MNDLLQGTQVFVLGALNLDLCGIPGGVVRMHDSNPGSVFITAGGVGHNIAHHLAQSGVSVELISLLGDDHAANILSRHCKAEGIGMRHTSRYPGSSCVYLCIHEQSGELTAAVNDMSLMDAFTPLHLEQYLPMLNDAPLICVDANLPVETLDMLTASVKAPILLDPVSGFKAKRVTAFLDRLEAIKPNAVEAAALSGREDPAAAAQWMLDQGTRQVFISLADSGVYYASAQGAGLLPATRMQIANTSGAGDALAAGIAIGMLYGMDTRACAQSGISCVSQYLLKQGGILL